MEISKFNLAKKYFLITGAAGLLGQEHAFALLEINANLVLTDINLFKLKKLKRKFLKLFPNQKIEILNIDVSKEKTIKLAVQYLKKKKNHLTWVN